MQKLVVFVPMGQLLRILFILFISYCPYNLFGSIEIGNSTCVCENGSPAQIEIIAEGSAGPFTFSWSGPNGYSSSEKNPQDILTPGIYTVVITNSYLCETFLTTNISSCAPLNLDAQPTPSCPSPTNSGAINLTVNGGTPPHTYLWSNAATSASLTGIPAGQYQVTVTDANGCTAEGDFVVDELTAPSIAGETSPSCSGQTDSGTINLTVTGGATPYSYYWDNDETNANLTGVTSGEYCVTVEDANGCSSSGCFIVGQFSTPNIFSMTTNNCTEQQAATGAVQVEVSGGEPPYAYAWSHGPTDEDQEELVGGTYKVTVTDINGCEAIETFVIEDLDPPNISAEVELATCLQSTDGQIVQAPQRVGLDYRIKKCNFSHEKTQMDKNGEVSDSPGSRKRRP